MKRLNLIYFLAGGALLGPVLAFLFFSMRNFGAQPDANSAVIERELGNTPCPEGATMIYSVWGKSGLIAKCQISHGKFLAAEHGKIMLRGEYSMGKLIVKNTNDQ